ncbi:unnamed protein product, partial [Discosporangium mesarthrocarpum]
MAHVETAQQSTLKIKDYNTRMRDMDREGKWEDALHLLKTMHEKGLTPDASTYRALVNCLTNAEEAEAAAQVMIEAMGPGGVQDISLGMCTTVLHMLLSQEKRRTALELFQSMRSSGCMHRHFLTAGDRVLAYCAACQACEGLGDWQEVTNIYKEYCQDMKEAEKIMSSGEMKGDGLEPG